MKKIVKQTRNKKKNIRYLFWSIRPLVSSPKILLGIIIFVIGVVSLFAMQSVSFKTKSKAEVYQSPSVAAAYANVDMSVNAGKELQENSEYLKSMQGSTRNMMGELDQSSVRGDSLKVTKDIYVLIGISQQVIKDHCDGSEEDRVIRADTLRCTLVEDLALRDLDEANKSFTETGKSYFFRDFVTPWDQTIDQGCDRASGGQTIPMAKCTDAYKENMLFIAILYVKGVENSGGESGGNFAYYIAPSIKRNENGALVTDYWKENAESSQYVLTHEIGHTLGENHFPTLNAESNSIIQKSFLFEDLLRYSVREYDSDLYYGVRKGDFNIIEWPLKLSQRCEYRLGVHCIDESYKYLLDNYIIGLWSDTEKKVAEGKYVVFGTQSYAGIDYSDKILEGDLQDDAIYVSNAKKVFYKRILFLTVVKTPTQSYYCWFTGPDVTVKYFNNKPYVPCKLMPIELTDDQERKIFEN